MSVIFDTGLKCQYKLIHGVECRSCGLTRGIYFCWIGDFDKAKSYNVFSVKFFTCNIFILISRFLLCFLTYYINLVKTVFIISTFEIITLISLFFTMIS